MARRKPVFSAKNLFPTVGVETLQRRPADQRGEYVDVDPQPAVMVLVVDEADPRANEKGSPSAQYGVLYVERDDDVRDKDVFWYHDPGGARFRWGVIGQARWNIDHALDNTNFGVKQFRVRRGG